MSRGNLWRRLNCRGELKIIAAIVQAPVIERILTHLGLLNWPLKSLSPNGGPRRSTRLVPARVQRQGGCGLNRACSNARNSLTRAGTWARLAVMATTSA